MALNRTPMLLPVTEADHPCWGKHGEAPSWDDQQARLKKHLGGLGHKSVTAKRMHDVLTKHDVIHPKHFAQATSYLDTHRTELSRKRRLDRSLQGYKPGENDPIVYMPDKKKQEWQEVAQQNSLFFEMFTRCYERKIALHESTGQDFLAEWSGAKTLQALAEADPQADWRASKASKSKPSAKPASFAAAKQKAQEMGIKGAEEKEADRKAYQERLKGGTLRLSPEDQKKQAGAKATRDKLVQRSGAAPANQPTPGTGQTKPGLLRRAASAAWGATKKHAPGLLKKGAMGVARTAGGLAGAGIGAGVGSALGGAYGAYRGAKAGLKQAQGSGLAGKLAGAAAGGLAGGALGTVAGKYAGAAGGAALGAAPKASWQAFKAYHGKPGEGQPPAGAQPAGGQAPTGEQPTGEQPAGAQPAGGQAPAGGKLPAAPPGKKISYYTRGKGGELTPASSATMAALGKQGGGQGGGQVPAGGQAPAQPAGQPYSYASGGQQGPSRVHKFIRGADAFMGALRGKKPDAAGGAPADAGRVGGQSGPVSGGEMEKAAQAAGGAEALGKQIRKGGEAQVIKKGDPRLGGLEKLSPTQSKTAKASGGVSSAVDKLKSARTGAPAPAGQPAAPQQPTAAPAATAPQAGATKAALTKTGELMKRRGGRRLPMARNVASNREIPLDLLVQEWIWR